MPLSIALLGAPGAGKSTLGLSAPGVQQHVFGSSEETTARNFTSRKDILKPWKSDWFACLDEKQRAKFVDETVKETELVPLMSLARTQNIIKYRRYLYGLKNEFLSGNPVMRPSLAGEPTELKSIFLDNGSPFADDFQDYVKMVFSKEFETKEGNFNSIAFSIKYKSELSDFLRMATEIPCNVIMSFHIGMAYDQADAAKANFMTDTAKGIRYAKEWQPMLMGQAKYILAGLFDYVFYLWAEENPGQPTKYLAKLEADDSTVGIAKSRLQPFVNPRRIVFPKNEMFPYFEKAILEFEKTGKQVDNKG
jgi:hypothetical protein